MLIAYMVLAVNNSTSNMLAILNIADPLEPNLLPKINIIVADISGNIVIVVGFIIVFMLLVTCCKKLYL